MPDPGIFLAFAAAVLAMQVTPGPDMMLVIGRGVGQGRRVALCTVIGMTLLSGSVQLPLLVLGVPSLLSASPLTFEALRWAGAGYLIWLGARLLRSSRHGHAAAAAQGGSAWIAMRDGTLNNQTNPKPLLFMFAFLPQFVDRARGPAWSQLLALGLLQKTCGMLVMGTVAFASGAVGGWPAHRPGSLAWQTRFTGTVIVALGLWMALVGDAPRPALG